MLGPLPGLLLQHGITLGGSADEGWHSMGTAWTGCAGWALERAWPGTPFLHCIKLASPSATKWHQMAHRMDMATTASSWAERGFQGAKVEIGSDLL
jgi:hypothetical protein